MRASTLSWANPPPPKVPSSLSPLPSHGSLLFPPPVWLEFSFPHSFVHPCQSRVCLLATRSLRTST